MAPVAEEEGMVSRAKILVVDDEPDILDIVRTNLEGSGYEVSGAATGVDALRQLKLLRPDLVILDVVMPEVDGWEVLRRMRRDPQSASTPIVMLTCLGEEAEILLGLAEGAVEYVTKPFDPEHLVATVDTLLEVFDSAMREERREWLLVCQQRKMATAPQPTIVPTPVYTRSNVEAPLFVRERRSA
jgi:two-component system, OmpR family, alkaline phosphatase synthesis response regulator PhoP